MISTASPSVSAVIPCYNGELFLSEAVLSVLRQTYPVVELIVVDDGSSDRSAEIARSFGSPVKLVQKENGGEGSARNRGIQEARGDLIAFLDADDVWHPDKLAHQVEYLAEHPGVGAVTTDVTVFKGQLDDVVYTTRLPEQFYRGLRPLDFLTGKSYLNQSAAMLRRSIARAVPYPEWKAPGVDMAHTTLLRNHAEFGRVTELLVFCRLHEVQISQQSDGGQRSLRFRVKWAQENYPILGFDSPDAAAEAVLSAAVQWVVAPFYSREFDELERRRALFLELWPRGRPTPPEVTRVVPPRWVFALWDLTRPLRSCFR